MLTVCTYCVYILTEKVSWTESSPLDVLSIYRYVMDVVVERCYAARANRSPSPFSRLLCEADSSLYCRSISSDGRELWLRERLGWLLTVLLRRRILYSSALYGDTFSFQSMHTI
jgi:hypothetical protein